MKALVAIVLLAFSNFVMADDKQVIEALPDTALANLTAKMGVVRGDVIGGVHNDNEQWHVKSVVFRLYIDDDTQDHELDMLTSKGKPQMLAPNKQGFIKLKLITPHVETLHWKILGAKGYIVRDSEQEKNEHMRWQIQY